LLPGLPSKPSLIKKKDTEKQLPGQTEQDQPLHEFDVVLNDPTSTVLYVTTNPKSKQAAGKTPLSAWIINNPNEAALFGKYCQSNGDLGNYFACLTEVLQFEREKLIDKHRAAQTIVQNHISPALKISMVDSVLIQDLLRKVMVGWTTEHLFSELEIALVDILRKPWDKFLKSLKK